MRLKILAASSEESSIPNKEFYILCSLTPQQDFGELSRVAAGNRIANGGELGGANALAGIQSVSDVNGLE